MNSWSEMLNSPEFLEKHPDYMVKISADSGTAPIYDTIKTRRFKKTREGAWVRKRLYKKKMVRRFLNLNPSMNYSQLYGTDCRRGIYLFCHDLDDDKYGSYPLYCLNRNNHIFLSVRGDLRIYHGALYSHGVFDYTMGGRDDIGKITNRRLRKLPFDAEGASDYAFCKKLCAPIPNDPW